MEYSVLIRQPADLDLAQLHALLKLRADVFVVEQGSAYADIDGHDLDPDTVHLWAQERGRVLGTVRVLRPAGPRPVIGRVATAPAARGRGVAGRLIRQAIALCAPGAQIHLEAQVQLEHWYARFGFARCGADFDDAGVMHLPMVRAGRRAALADLAGREA